MAEKVEEIKEATPSKEEAKAQKKKILKWTHDITGGKVLFETQGYGEKEKIKVEINGKEEEIENYGNLAIYSRGASFKEFPAVKY